MCCQNTLNYTLKKNLYQQLDKLGMSVFENVRGKRINRAGEVKKD